MNKLKPCPFCGGEAKMIAGTYHDGGCIPNYARVECRECGATMPEVNEHLLKEYVKQMAAEIWNNRSERVCRNISKYGKNISYQDETNSFDFVCSSCGANVNCDAMGNSPLEPEEDELAPLKYCPNCGAKVVK